MSFEEPSIRKNVKLFSKRYSKLSENEPKSPIIEPEISIPIPTTSSLSSSSSIENSSSSDSDSSSNEVDFDEIITGNNSSHNRISSKSLPIIFEMSEDSTSVCSLQSSTNKSTNQIAIAAKDRKITTEPITEAEFRKINGIKSTIVDNVEHKLLYDSPSSSTSSSSSLDTSTLSSENSIEVHQVTDNKLAMQTMLTDRLYGAVTHTDTLNNGDTLAVSVPKSDDDNKINNHNNNSSSIVAQSLIVTKRTPRFPVQKSSAPVTASTSVSNHDSQTVEMQQPRAPLFVKKSNKTAIPAPEIVTDLDDDLQSFDTKDNVLKNQMLKNYSKDELIMASSKPLKIADRNNPTKKSQEISGNIVKMDRTINHVTNDIVRIDNAISRLNQFNRGFLANLEQMSDAELSSVVDTQSNAAQTDPVEPDIMQKLTENLSQLNIPKRGRQRKQQQQLSESESSSDSSDENDDSSTEMESGCEQHVACKQPSPVHQQVPTPQPRPTVASIKSRAYATPDSELSSLPESSVCDEPEKRNIHDQVKYFQRQIKKSSGLYKQSSGAEEPPKRLVVVEESGSSSKMRVRPPPQPRRPRSSVNGSGSHFSTSSSESSSNCDYTSRTLSNMGGGVGGQSPLNSDDDGGGAGIMAENGSILSLSSTRGGTDQRHFQKAIGGGASGRFNKKNGGTGGRTGGDKLGTYRGHFDDECASMSGKPVMAGGATKSPGKVAYLPHSRSYNSLNVLPTNGGGGGGAGGGIGNYATTGRHGRASNGHLAGMTGGSGNDDMQLQQHLCDLIRRHLILGYHDRIRDLFRALIRDNGRDKVEDLIDSFHNEDRDILLQLAAEVGFGLKEAESIFDIRLSRSDLNNRLHPGLSVSSLSTAEPLAGYSSGGDRMVLWRADLEELPPPPIRPPPKPMPTALLKAAIVSTETMAHVDDRVEQILQFDPTTFTELVSFLTQDCSNDVEKVRVLYRWITMYDTKFLSFDPAAPNDSLIGVLRSIKCGQMTYNELFYHLCRYAGINCQYISGYSKGAGYRPGMTIKDNRMFRNVWTAVFVAGAWRFVNCNWGARYLSSRHHNHHTSGSGGVFFSASSTLLHNTATTGTLQSLANRGTLQSQQHLQRQEEQKHRCDEFYFLTDAKQHIFEHLPDNRRWQLLNRPINLDQFMALPIVKSPFFNAGLSFKRNYAETLQTKNGKVTIKINMPRAVAVSCRLENRADGTLLRGLTLIQIIDLQTIVVTAAPSQPGKFYLSVYVSHPDDDWRFASEQTLSSTSGALEMACSFQVHCSEHNYDRLVTGRFPEVGLLGPTPAATNLGISVNPGVGPFVVWDQRSSMKVNVTVGPGLRVGHLMMSYDRSGHNSASCDSYALLQRLPGQTAVSNRGSQHQYHIRFPVDAFYCLTVFAGRSGDQDDEPTTGTAASALELQCDQDRLMQCVYRLLVDCRRPHDQVPAYPRQTSRWVNCRLMQPLDQQLQLSTHYRFSVEAPQCGAVAVVINDDPHNEWYDLRTSVKSHGLWKAKIWTGDKLDRLSVYGRLGSSAAGAAASAQQDEEYVKLLDYVLIPRLTR